MWQDGVPVLFDLCVSLVCVSVLTQHILGNLTDKKGLDKSGNPGIPLQDPGILTSGVRRMRSSWLVHIIDGLLNTEPGP